MLSESTALLAGKVTNGGTLFASGSGSLIKIVNGVVVNGGVAEVGNGLVAILGSSSENVSFLSNGNGRTCHRRHFGPRNRVQGSGIRFWGRRAFQPYSIHRPYLGHLRRRTDHFELRLCQCCQHQRHAGRVIGGRAGRGDHDGRPVFGGQLRHRVWQRRDGRDHRSDRPQWWQCGARPRFGLPAGGIDLPNIAFGAHTTLAFSENAAGTGGTLTVSDGRHAASILLLGNYVAGSFAIAGDGHGGTLVTEAQQTEPRLLAHPRA
jgi:hypothetical protein